jgi:DNA polymerase-3 subunit alpha
MIRYAAERYGRDHVAQIITFGTIKARNAVRDAAACSASRTASATASPRRCRRW